MKTLKKTYPKGIKAIEDIDLLKDIHARKVTIPSSVTKLPIGAFHDFQKLQKVYIQDGDLTIIPAYCFSKLTSLKTVRLPKQLITIDEKAFEHCVSIERLEVPEDIEFIHNEAFNGWQPHQTLVFPRPFKLSPSCKATIIVPEEMTEALELPVGYETDGTDKFYLVETKCGHVSRKYYMPVVFPIKATSKKEAARIARNKPRVKHDHQFAIINVTHVTEKKFLEHVELNRNDPYLQVKNIQQQRQIHHLIEHRLIKEMK